MAIDPQQVRQQIAKNEFNDRFYDAILRDDTKAVQECINAFIKERTEKEMGIEEARKELKEFLTKYSTSITFKGQTYENPLLFGLVGQALWGYNLGYDAMEIPPT